MGKIKDLTGKKFGMLKVISRAGVKYNRRVIWLCKCDCGNEVEVGSELLIGGKTKSCGCIRGNGQHKRGKDFKGHRHGMSYTPIHDVWLHMRQRCYNPRDSFYADYGGRGITVCEKWETFEGFYEDMGPLYQDGLTIDRIDVNGNYCKDNCRWVDSITQANNKRNNRIETIGGVTDTLTNLCRLYGISERAVRTRLKIGWSIEKALKTPIRPHKKYKEYGK